MKTPFGCQFTHAHVVHLVMDFILLTWSLELRSRMRRQNCGRILNLIVNKMMSTTRWTAL